MDDESTKNSCMTSVKEMALPVDRQRYAFIPGPKRFPAVVTFPLDLAREHGGGDAPHASTQ